MHVAIPVRYIYIVFALQEVRSCPFHRELYILNMMELSVSSSDGIPGVGRCKTLFQYNQITADNCVTQSID